MTYQKELAEKLRGLGIRGVATHIAADLIGQPVVSPTRAQHLYNVSHPAASAAIRRLESIGVLREMSDAKYRRTYVAPEVIRILSS
jgi:hypothetical protein